MVTSTNSDLPTAYHVLAKPTGPICNLDCEYCFFLSKEQLYPGDRFRMADEMLEHNGDLYSCDHYVEPEHLLGNIAETPMIDLVASPQQVSFGQAKRDSLPAFCRNCEVRFGCHGGCPRNRFVQTPDARRRGRPELPVPVVQGVLQPHRSPDAADVATAARKTRPVGGIGVDVR